MLLDVDLDRALTQALEERPGHALMLGDWGGTEVGLRVGGQRASEEEDDRLLNLLHDRDGDVRSLVGVADALLKRVELGASKRVARRSELIHDDHRKQDGRDEADRRTEGVVEDQGGNLDLTVRQLCRGLDDHQDRSEDPKEPIDLAVRQIEVRRLPQYAAGLHSHVGCGQQGQVHGDQCDQPSNHAGEKAADRIDDEQPDDQEVDPGHVLNLAWCLFSNVGLISPITFSTSASVRVRSGLRKVKVNAMLLCPPGPCAPWYSSTPRAVSSSSPAASLIDASSVPAATCSSTTTARSRSTAGNLGSGCAFGSREVDSTGSTSISKATSLPSSFTLEMTVGCSSPRYPSWRPSRVTA